MPIIPASRRYRQEDLDFKASLGYKKQPHTYTHTCKEKKEKNKTRRRDPKLSRYIVKYWYKMYYLKKKCTT